MRGYRSHKRPGSSDPRKATACFNLFSVRGRRFRRCCRRCFGNFYRKLFFSIAIHYRPRRARKTLGDFRQNFSLICRNACTHELGLPPSVQKRERRHLLTTLKTGVMTSSPIRPPTLIRRANRTATDFGEKKEGLSADSTVGLTCQTSDSYFPDKPQTGCETSMPLATDSSESKTGVFKIRVAADLGFQ